MIFQRQIYENLIDSIIDEWLLKAQEEAYEESDY